MTHPPEHELLAFADGELSTPRVHDVSGHLAECALCGTRLDEIRRPGARIPVLLSALDHRPFDVSASALIARATRPTTPRATRSITPRWHSLIAAGIALLFLGSVATAAVPASIIRQYLARLFAVPSSTEPCRGRHLLPWVHPRQWVRTASRSCPSPPWMSCFARSSDGVDSGHAPRRTGRPGRALRGQRRICADGQWNCGGEHRRARQLHTHAPTVRSPDHHAHRNTHRLHPIERSHRDRCREG